MATGSSSADNHTSQRGSSPPAPTRQKPSNLSTTLVPHAVFHHASTPLGHNPSQSRILKQCPIGGRFRRTRGFWRQLRATNWSCSLGCAAEPPGDSPGQRNQQATAKGGNCEGNRMPGPSLSADCSQSQQLAKLWVDRNRQEGIFRRHPILLIEKATFSILKCLLHMNWLRGRRLTTPSWSDSGGWESCSSFSAFNLASAVLQGPLQRS